MERGKGFPQHFAHTRTRPHAHTHKLSMFALKEVTNNTMNGLSQNVRVCARACARARAFVCGLKYAPPKRKGKFYIRRTVANIYAGFRLCVHVRACFSCGCIHA